MCAGEHSTRCLLLQGIRNGKSGCMGSLQGSLVSESPENTFNHGRRVESRNVTSQCVRWKQSVQGQVIWD